MTTPQKTMFTTKEAAVMLSCSVKTVRDYINAHKLTAVRRGGGDYLIHENNLRIFLGLEPDEPLMPVSQELTNAPSSQGNSSGDPRPTEGDGETPSG